MPDNVLLVAGAPVDPARLDRVLYGPVSEPTVVLAVAALDDPLEAVDHCMRLLAPGGVLCLVTPDPASRTARLAGPRWWGYLPAHTYLVPRQTLRSLLGERGMDVVDERSLVRSFTLRYWMAGLAERGGAVGAGVSFVRRFTPGRVSVSLSLGDETVLIARKGARAGRPARSARFVSEGPALPVGQ
jgi:hypothetical protein